MDMVITMKVLCKYLVSITSYDTIYITLLNVDQNKCFCRYLTDFLTIPTLPSAIFLSGVSSVQDALSKKEFWNFNLLHMVTK